MVNPNVTQIAAIREILRMNWRALRNCRKQGITGDSLAVQFLLTERINLKNKLQRLEQCDK